MCVGSSHAGVSGSGSTGRAFTVISASDSRSRAAAVTTLYFELVGEPSNRSDAVVGKQIVICLDGTNNKVKGADNTNVLRTYQMLLHGNPDKLVSFYQPGVGTFSAPGAWTVTGRKVTKLLGLAFGVGLRQNLGNAYAFLMDHYEDGDEIFVFGFSRGAYTARALTGMLAAFGLFRPGAENLIPYAIEAMSRGDADTAPRPGVASAPAGDSDPVTPEQARPLPADAATGQERPSEKDWRLLFEFSDTFARRGGNGAIVVPVKFLGLWDTVEAAGTLRRQIQWPYTRHLPHVEVVRHAISIDEWRRPFAGYPVLELDPVAGVSPQDLEQVWFSGVHSDVGGMFADGARLSDVPLKWMAQAAAAAGLLLDPAAFAAAQQQVTTECATGAIHTNSPIWLLAGGRRLRKLPETGAVVHASVATRLQAHPDYRRRLPPAGQYTIIDDHWLDSILP